MVTKEDLVNYTNLMRSSIDILNKQKQILMYLSSNFSGAKTEDDKGALYTILSNVSKNLETVSSGCNSVISEISSSFESFQVKNSDEESR